MLVLCRLTTGYLNLHLTTYDMSEKYLVCLGSFWLCRHGSKHASFSTQTYLDMLQTVQDTAQLHDPAFRFKFRKYISDGDDTFWKALRIFMVQNSSTGHDGVPHYSMIDDALHAIGEDNQYHCAEILDKYHILADVHKTSKQVFANEIDQKKFKAMWYTLLSTPSIPVWQKVRSRLQGIFMYVFNDLFYAHIEDILVL